jgi:hypothetical protein
MLKLNRKHMYLMSSSLGLVFIFNQRCSSTIPDCIIDDQPPSVISQSIDNEVKEEDEINILSLEFF